MGRFSMSFEIRLSSWGKTEVSRCETVPNNKSEESIGRSGGAIRTFSARVGLRLKLSASGVASRFFTVLGALIGRRRGAGIALHIALPIQIKGREPLQNR